LKLHVAKCNVSIFAQ